MERKCKNCFLPLGPTQTECSNCGAHNPLPQGATMYSSSTTVIKPSPDGYPMAWFKFVIYFQLFAACVLNLINAVSVFNATHLEGLAEEFYAKSPSLMMADKFYGFALIVLAVLCIVARFRLAGFYSNGPTLYYVMLVGNIVAACTYGLLASNAGTVVLEVGGYFYQQTYTYQFQWSSVLGSIVGSVVLLLCNRTYFNKRSELFYN